MMEVFKRSWSLTKLSFQVLLDDKELLLFPLMSGIFSILFIIALLYPTLISGVLQDGSSTQVDVISYILMGVTYFVLAFVATFFNVCVVYTTRVRFEGGNATFMESLRFALSKIHLIAAWSAVSASVGLLLHAIDRLAQRAGPVGHAILGVVRTLLGLAWSVVTVFVIPVMVYQGTGPFESIKLSVGALKKTWGESLIRHYGLGMAQSLFLFVGIFVLVFIAVGLASIGTVGLVIGISLLVVYILGVVLVFSVLNNVFNTAIYVYATTGSVPGHYEQGQLAGVFGSKA